MTVNKSVVVISLFQGFPGDDGRKGDQGKPGPSVSTCLLLWFRKAELRSCCFSSEAAQIKSLSSRVGEPVCLPHALDVVGLQLQCVCACVRTFTQTLGVPPKQLAASEDE